MKRNYSKTINYIISNHEFREFHELAASSMPGRKFFGGSLRRRRNVQFEYFVVRYIIR